MAESRPQRVRHAAAWTSAEIGGKEGLVHRIGAEHAAALRALADRLRDKPAVEISREEFDHPAVNELMRAVRYQIMKGLGGVVISGLDLAGMPLEEFERIYWGLGTHLGVAAPQSYRGDKIGYVQKEDHNPTGRGYISDVELRSHTDFHEVLALACYRTAAEGGLSGVVSSLALHNLLLDERPDLLELLYEGYYHESSGGQVTPGKVPVFCSIDGQVSCFFHSLFMLSAARIRGEEFPPKLKEALDYMSALALRPEVRADFLLEPGEMLFWHNFTLLHSRTSFRNEGEQKRLLLRLWLNVPDGRKMAPEFTERARMMDEAHGSGRAALEYAPDLLKREPEPADS